MENEVPEKVDACEAYELHQTSKGFMPFVRKHQNPIIIVLTAGIIVTVVTSNVFLKKAVRRGIDAAEQTYVEAKDEAYKNTYQQYQNVGYSIAEANHHVSNSVLITVADIKKTAKLEVLRVQDVEYIIEKAEDNNYGIDAWLQVGGNGVFTVDLEAAQFLTNQERKSVIIKLPKPRLTNCKVDGKSEPLLFKNQGLNETFKEGAELAKEQRKEAEARIKDEFMTNPIYMKSAKNSAESILKSWVKELNPDIPELTVEIIFTDD